MVTLIFKWQTGLFMINWTHQCTSNVLLVALRTKQISRRKKGRILSHTKAKWSMVALWLLSAVVPVVISVQTYYSYIQIKNSDVSILGVQYVVCTVLTMFVVGICNIATARFLKRQQLLGLAYFATERLKRARNTIVFAYIAALVAQVCLAFFNGHTRTVITSTCLSTTVTLFSD